MAGYVYDESSNPLNLDNPELSIEGKSVSISVDGYFNVEVEYELESALEIVEQPNLHFCETDFSNGFHSIIVRCARCNFLYLMIVYD